MLWRTKIINLISLMWLVLPVYAAELYGHRGARGLAPENTLPAYEVALKNNVDVVDMDIGMTKDHVVVVQHDLTLNPEITRDDKGRWIQKKIIVKNLTLKQLQSYDVGRTKSHTDNAKWFPNQKAVDGTHIPTLEQVIDYVNQHAQKKMYFQIEIKTDPTTPDWTYSPEVMAQAVADVLHEKNMVDRTEVQAYDWRCLFALQKIDPKIKTAYLTDIVQEKLMQDPDPQKAGLWTGGYLLKNYHNSIPEMIHALGGKLWDPQDLELTQKELEKAHQLGLKVVTWSWVGKYGKEFNQVMVKKLVAMGVDGVITDRPDLAEQYVHV